MKLSFKDRIAIYYMLATAFIVAFAFLVVFILVKQTVYQQLDSDLHYEATIHLQETTLENGRPVFWDKEEWEERVEGSLSPLSLGRLTSPSFLRQGECSPFRLSWL